MFCGATVDFSLAQLDLGGREAVELTRPLISVDEDDSSMIRNAGEEDTTTLITGSSYHVLLGNRKWIKEKNFIEIPAEVESRLVVQERRGHTAILAAIDGIFH